MRNFFLILLSLISFSCFAQGNNFIVENEKLVWENVIISSESNIPNIIGRHSRLKITSSDGNVYSGKGIEVRNTCPGTSDFLKGDYSFNFEIELRDGKYRVTVTNIVFSKSLKKQKSITPAEKYFIVSGKIKDNTNTEADLACIENYITKLFSPVMAYKSKS
jgi:hypothetical protein